MDRSGLAYWETTFAGGARAWVAPISPAPQDIAHVERQVGALAAPSPRALLLGVTQSLAHMRWPAGTSLAALDWSRNMIERIWRANPVPDFACAVRGDWREMPLASASLDVAVGDGCYLCLGSYEDAALLNREVHRALKTGGIFCQRCFARPDKALTVDAVLDDLRAGRFPNVFLFRWMFMTAAHGVSRRGITLDEIWRAWSERQAEARPALERLGWQEDAAWAFGRFKGLGQRYIYPHPEELRELAEPLFDLVEYHVPAYERGECFPSLVMRSRAWRPRR